MKDKPKQILQVQPMMVSVIVGLLPCLAGAVYFFGWRALLLCVFVCATGFLAEAAFTLRQGKPVTSAVFVTGLIYTLSLPPTLPFWMAGVGMVFGVVFGKMAFGGFGHNVYNPAMAGRCFIYFAFPLALTSRWDAPVSGMAGGLTAYAPGIDAVTSATPLAALASGGPVDWQGLLLGNVSGSLGETSVVLIVLGGAYVLYKKHANYRLLVSCLAGGLVMGLGLFLAGAGPNPLAQLVSGAFAFGAFFVVTEPISGPKTNEGRWIYGFAAGCLIVVFRSFSNFNEGVMFAVLFLNTFVPLLDMGVRAMKKRQKARAAS